MDYCLFCDILEVCQVGTDEIPVLTATDHKVGPFSEYLWNTKYLDGTELLIADI